MLVIVPAMNDGPGPKSATQLQSRREPEPTKDQASRALRAPLCVAWQGPRHAKGARGSQTGVRDASSKSKIGNPASDAAEKSARRLGATQHQRPRRGPTRKRESEASPVDSLLDVELKRQVTRSLSLMAEPLILGACGP